MKINELKFEQRSDGIDGTTARVFFPNGYGASIITGAMFYTSYDAPYELAVLHGDAEKSSLCYDTPITNDVLGYQTASDVERTLDEIASLTPAT